MKNKGFTMIEIVVTISMLLLASSILIGTVIGVTRRNEKQKIEDVRLALASAATIYFSEKGVCPDNSNGTTAIDKLLAEKLISKDLVEPYTVAPYTINWGSDCEDVTAITITKT